MPSLDEMFPSLAQLILNPITEWVLLFPLSRDCSAALEAGADALGDLAYAPNRFASAEELLISLDSAAELQPDEATREDAFSRLVFPAELPPKATARYEQYVAELQDFDKALSSLEDDSPESLEQLSEEHQYRAHGPKEVTVRLSVAERDAAVKELRARGFDFAAAFPKCAAAHDADALYWISYRGGVLRLCKGDGMQGGERGNPPKGGELAKHNVRARTLQDLFCVAEALWPAGLDTSKTAGVVDDDDDAEMEGEEEFDDD
eukprot:418003-Prymnesium_polylepis.1